MNPLVAATVSGTEVGEPRDLGRRDVEYRFWRVLIPTLILDHAWLQLRQMGLEGREKFLLLAGSLAGGDAFVSTLVLPKTVGGALHGSVPADVASHVFRALDARDLVPIAQLHSHPADADMSITDRERPLFAHRGFLSIIIPYFGFVPALDLSAWRTYEYRAPREWHALDLDEQRARFVIDDSLIRVD